MSNHRTDSATSTPGIASVVRPAVTGTSPDVPARTVPASTVDADPGWDHEPDEYGWVIDHAPELGTAPAGDDDETVDPFSMSDALFAPFSMESAMMDAVACEDNGLPAAVLTYPITAGRFDGTTINVALMDAEALAQVLREVADGLEAGAQATFSFLAGNC